MTAATTSSATSPRWKRRKPLTLVALLLTLSLASCVGTRPSARLIAMNAFGDGYLTPPAAPIAATPASAAADLSPLNVDFRRTDERLGGLSDLLPTLTTQKEVRDGWLVLRGRPYEAGWYSDRSGPMLHRVVTGDFLVETRVRATRAGAPGARPEGSFNSAGLIIRDPAGGVGRMRWAMYNIGMQDAFYGSEAKSTVPEIGVFHPHRLAGFRSASTLWLTPAPERVVEAELRMCRIGPEIRMYRRYAGEGVWREETREASTVAQGNGLSRATPGVGDAGPIRFLKPELPSTVQVGLIVNPGFPPNDGEGQFQRLRFERIADFGECTR